jgi:hypothetical protein
MHHIWAHTIDSLERFSDFDYCHKSISYWMQISYCGHAHVERLIL